MLKTNAKDMNYGKAVLSAIDTLNYSAFLVEKIGRFRLSSGKTLGDTLTVEGIPLWDMLSAELACYHIPIALASKDSLENIFRWIRPYLSCLKNKYSHLLHSRENTSGCLTWPGKTSFLCLGFSQHIYRDVLQSVAARIAGRPDCRVVSLGDQTWRNADLSSHPAHVYQTIWQHWNRQLADQAFNLQKKIDRVEKELYSSNALSSIICEEGGCAWGSFQNLFSWIFWVRFPQLIYQAVVARHVLGEHRPALVISPDLADPRTRVYASICQQMDIPCLGVQFGLAGEEGVEWRFFSADKIAVWGDTSKEAMLKQKVPEDRIVITGSPRHDDLFYMTDRDVEEKKARLGIAQDHPVIVLASTYHAKALDKYSNPKILRSMQRSIFEAADKAKKLCLIVKPHPFENARNTRVLAGRCRNILFVSPKSDIRDLVKICDAFISFGSTTTIDALIADKLTICPIFPGWTFSDIFKHGGATLVPESGEEIANIFKMVANGSYRGIKAKLAPARQAFLGRYTYRMDGMAADRIEALALRMAGMGV